MSVRRNRRSTCIGVSATTEAVRGPPSIAESSPKKSPGMTAPTRFLPRDDLALTGQDDEQRLARVALLDDRFCPGPNASTSASAARRCRCRLEKPANIGTPRQRHRGLPFGPPGRLFGPPVTHLMTGSRDAPCPAGSGSWREPTLPRFRAPTSQRVSSLVAPFERPLGLTHGCRARLRALLAERIVVLDGAWGVLLQGRGLTEEDFRGDRFADHPRDVKGDPDLLNLTQPDIVAAIHRDYLEAGADITTTNTFTATSIGQGDYGLQDAVYDMNVEGARLARTAADAFEDRFVAGSVGPLNVTLSLSPKVEDPAFRTVDVRRGVRGATPSRSGASGTAASTCC